MHQPKSIQIFLKQRQNAQSASIMGFAGVIIEFLLIFLRQIFIWET